MPLTFAVVEHASNFKTIRTQFDSCGRNRKCRAFQDEFDSDKRLNQILARYSKRVLAESEKTRTMDRSILGEALSAANSHDARYVDRPPGGVTLS